MFKKEIEYIDYNGEHRKETYYFNLSKAELMEMELSTTAGVDEMIRMMIATNDNAKIVKTFKDLILKSVGIKSEDGRRFIKSSQIRDEFEQSEAYSEFFIQLISDPKEQTAFVNGVINGANVPNMTEAEAIEKLKELGYDTERIESVLNKNENKVVDIEEKKDV